ncbi:hypothetical protein B0H14DRAFT_3473649 [Mycena olivaceomarginata]|nr:hypothetical protein B0H14DRAFT_3473649 [Mycena olivaceomarginata]
MAMGTIPTQTALVHGFHQRLPFHHIERWDGQCFERCTLKSLGIRIQLGHRLGEKCPNPAPASGENSPGPVEAGAAVAHATLPRDWDKSSVGGDVLCVAPFCTHELGVQVLGVLFHHRTMQEHYQEFLRMTCQWMHLQLVKRAGRGHDPYEDRINATQARECALLCPACPQPRKNLPPGWENVPFHKVFLYVLYIALDANFRLRRRDVSSEEKDPGFMKGWAFFGEVTKYMAHLEKHVGQIQEQSTCVAHNAVDKPNRESLGTASSGIGTVNCRQHNMKRPNGVDDLQQGECYLNMDYILFTSLAHIMQLIRFYILYDITCQWFKNLFTRMGIFDSDPQFRSREQYLVFLVPKFHLPAHIEVCNLVFSFNLTPFVGQTDGEAPERGWADTNQLANSTSISGPGARRDALDAHFQYWNWKKIVSLGNHTPMKYVPMMLEMRAAWVDLEASFADTVIETWTAMAMAWEADPSQPNHFVTTPSGREDLKELRIRGDMHETEMLSMGLQLEDQQRALATHVKHIGLHKTVDQGRKRIERETKLRCKIKVWMVIQQLFIPEPLPGIRAQDVKLWMLSAVGRHVQCDQALQEYRFQLRKGQCEASLDELRNNLLLRTHEYQYRNGVHGAKAKVRSGTQTNALTAQITKASEEYRAAHAALVNLGTIFQCKGWEKHYKVLAEADVHGRPSVVFGDDERRRHGRRKKKRRLDPAEEAMEADRMHRCAEDGKAMSWIWVMEGMIGEDSDVVHNEALRIEWAKTRAKAMRYVEEVDLLEEEMRHVLQFPGWHAREQAAYMKGLQSRFRSQWRDIDKLLMSTRKTYVTMLPDEDEEEMDTDTDMDEGEQGAGPAAAWLLD